MASLLANGISSFSPQPTPDSSKSPKSFHPKPDSFKFPSSSSKTLIPTPRLVKARADVGTIESNPAGNSSSSSTDKLQQYFQNLDYDKKYGFVEDIDSFTIPKGLSEETIRSISTLKEEPDWMLDFRFKAYAKFLTLKEPQWSDNRYPPIDFNNMCYYSAPKKKPTLNSLDEADPQLLEYFDKLGVPLTEQKRLANVAVDAVLDSVSIATTHRKTLEKSGVIFCSISEAIREYPDLIKKYLGRVVPIDDNYYAALNSAVFSDGSFCYIPKNTRCPMPISTYFRINAMETGQFERTLIVAEEGSFVEYLEGCTAPSYDTNQLHAAVVELYCGEGAEIKYSTRGLCAGDRSKISWTQVETGSAITWKYPSVVLEGDDSVGEFYSNAKNTSVCDSMLIGDKAAANTYPYIQVKNPSAKVEHEASTSKIGEDQLFYFQQRGIDHERALAAMISGFCRDVFNKLPDEFGAEVNQLMSIKLEGSVG
ncbi:BnaA09g20260D [Brassica napus]|uniref:BnaA09g20260D protein n=1 Tax=Brassica napus TaxID=3708 RepID=A0A078FW43_BRANA|nr:BnaA09g20260D [Brassica napus]